MKRDGKGTGVARDAERARWVGRYRASGLGLKRFAEQMGLSAGQLRYWVYAGNGHRVSAGKGPVFEEFVLPGVTSATQRGWDAEIGLADGTCIRLGRGADAQWASALVKSLRPSPCSP